MKEETPSPLRTPTVFRMNGITLRARLHVHFPPSFFERMLSRTQKLLSANWNVRHRNVKEVYEENIGHQLDHITILKSLAVAHCPFVLLSGVVAGVTTRNQFSHLALGLRGVIIMLAALPIDDGRGDDWWVMSWYCGDTISQSKSRIAKNNLVR